MILVGIDEAGLGPPLGPLVAALAALRVPDGWTAETPWDAWRDAVARDAPAADPRLPVDDSKRVLAKGGLAALERVALALYASGPGAGTLPASRRAWLAGLEADDANTALADCPWHAEDAWRFPVAADADTVARDAAAWTRALAQDDAAVAGVWARVLSPGPLNDCFAAGRNKHEVALASVASLLRAAAERWPGERVEVVVDKQGGRDRYGPFLSDAFAGAWWRTEREGREGSVYTAPPDARPGGGALRAGFFPKADARAFPVALASLVAKYTRERCMMELNAWFAARRPGLRATAGYPMDARRFLADVADTVTREKIDLHLLVRAR